MSDPYRTPGRETTPEELADEHDDGSPRFYFNHGNGITVTGMHGIPFVEGPVFVPSWGAVLIWRDYFGWHWCTLSKQETPMSKVYHSRKTVEALRWEGTRPSVDMMSVWFEAHGAAFRQESGTAILPDGRPVGLGCWIVFVDDHFEWMSDRDFTEQYE